MLSHTRSLHADFELDEFNKRQTAIQTERKNYIANQYRIFSITYASFFCLLGIVLTTIEPFKACKYRIDLNFFVGVG
jgi:hypothetical protein